MYTIKCSDLHRFLSVDGGNYDNYEELAKIEFDGEEDERGWSPDFTKEVFDTIKACDIYEIMVDFNVSENDPGGEDFVDVAADVAKACKDGYDICTWYDEDTTNVLIVGYRPDQLTLTKED